MGNQNPNPGPRLIPSIDALRQIGEFYGLGEGEMPDVWDELSIRRYWYDNWRTAIEDDFDVTILIDGKSGIGKSALAISIGMELDHSFTSRTIPDHIAFTASEFLNCIEKATKGQVIIYDEAVRGMMSTETFANEQKAIVTALAIVRAKNLIMILLAPDLWLVAKSFRARRAGWWIHVEDRGIAWVHVRDDRVRYEQDPKLGLYIDRLHGPFTWDSLDDRPIWKTYYRMKMLRVASYLKEAQVELQVQKNKKLGIRKKKGEMDVEEATT